MIHTINFLFEVKRSGKLKNRIIRNLTEQGEDSIIIKDFLLKFDFKEDMVHISCINPDYPFIYKCPELDWTFAELEEVIKNVTVH